MKTPAGYVCDWEDCQRVKGPVNGWFLMWEDRSETSPATLCLTRWDGIFADYEHAQHLCGAECAAKAQAEWISVQQERERKFQKVLT